MTTESIQLKSVIVAGIVLNSRDRAAAEGIEDNSFHDEQDTMGRDKPNRSHFFVPILVRFAILFAIAFLILGKQSVNAAPPKIECSVSEKEVFLRESITYQVDIQNAQNPSIPNLDGFSDQFTVEFLGESSNQSSTIIINGRITESSSRTYQFRLTPKLAGTLKIPAVNASIDGKTIKSNALTVRVLDIPMQDTVVVEVVSNETKVYPTQSFSIKLRVLIQPIADTGEEPLRPLKRNPPMIQVNWLKPPDGVDTNDTSEWLQPLLSKNNVGFSINGVNADSGSFFRQRLAVFDLSSGREKRDGLQGTPINYFVYELERKFVAKKTGTYTFGPASVKGTFATGITAREYDAARIVAIAPAVSVEVKEVPLPRPANFIGGIGNYVVNATATPNKLRVGDPMTLTLQFMRGKESGSLELISAPDLNAIQEVSDQFDIVDKSPVGRVENNSKKFAFALRPKRAGVSIPAMSLSTFDPTSEKFTSIITDPVSITVSEASSIVGGDLVGSVGSGNAVADIKTRSEGIFHNITDVSQLRDERLDLANGLKWVGGLWLGAGIAIASIIVFRRQSSDLRRQRRVSARRTAQSRLAAAKSLKQDKHKEALREVRAAILGLVADTGNQIADGLTTADVNAAMSAAEVPTDYQSRLQKLLESIESAEYGASDTADSSGFIKEALELVDRVAPILERRSAR